MAVSGGYDVECLEAVPPSWECSICTLILRKPVQTACGHRYCYNCLIAYFKLHRKNSKCPIDREIINHEKVFDDKALERDILSIKVKCSNHKHKCDWTGELRNLETHVNDQCPGQKILCKNEDCLMLIFRSDLIDHMCNSCQYRSLVCIHCTEEYTYINQEVHWESCPRFPVLCTNNCGDAKMPREKIQEHLSICQLAVLPCSFANIGCSVEFLRRDEETHMCSYVSKHLQLSVLRMTNFEKTCQEQKKSIEKQKQLILEQKNSIEEQNKITMEQKKSIEKQNKLILAQKKSIEELNKITMNLSKKIRTIQYSEANSFIMEIEKFKEKMELEKTTEEQICSEPHIINYYKMRLHVFLNGHDTGKGRYISIYFQLMKGDYDDCLSWPFTKSVILTVMHPENSRYNCKKILTYSEPDYDDDSYDDDYDNYYCDDIGQLFYPGDDELECKGYHEFIRIKKLHSEGYIKDDRLFIKCELSQ